MSTATDSSSSSTCCRLPLPQYAPYVLHCSICNHLSYLHKTYPDYDYERIKEFTCANCNHSHGVGGWMGFIVRRQNESCGKLFSGGCRGYIFDAFYECWACGGWIERSVESDSWGPCTETLDSERVCGYTLDSSCVLKYRVYPERFIKSRGTKWARGGFTRKYGANPLDAEEVEVTKELEISAWRGLDMSDIY